MKRCGLIVILAAVLALAWSVIANAQQSTKKKVPSLTTEDVISNRAVPTTETQSEEAKGEGDKGGQKVSAEEAKWRDQVKQARRKAETLKRQADETELGINQLRNQLSAPGLSPNEHNQIGARMQSEGQRLADLRAQQKAAEQELEALLEEGQAKGYSEASGPSPTDASGAPNEKYYTTRYAELLSKLQDDKREVEMYDLRVKDINSRITNNSRTGDNYFIGKLQQELQDAQQSLDKAKQAYSEHQQEIDQLKEQAREAGVPPGIFR